MITVGLLLDPNSSDAEFSDLMAAIEHASERSNRDYKEAWCVWDDEGNPQILFIGGYQWNIA